MGKRNDCMIIMSQHYYHFLPQVCLKWPRSNINEPFVIGQHICGKKKIHSAIIHIFVDVILVPFSVISITTIILF